MITFDRRELLTLAGLSVATIANIGSAQAAQTQPTEAIKAVKLTTSERVVHSTVLLTSQITHDKVQFGTGFLFGLLWGTKKVFPAIITNKHVLEGMKDCQFDLTERDGDGNPILTKHIPVTIPNVTKHAIWHPDPAIDLAMIPFWDIVNALEEKPNKPFVVMLSAELIPDKSFQDAMTPLEEVLTVGYPGGVRDNVNNLPVLHKGITATPAYLDFQGQKQFLIDIAMWPGASGSPVFLYKSGTVYNERSSNVSFGEQVSFLGVARQVVEQDVDWKVRGQEQVQQIPGTPVVPTNLGVCIKSASVLDFENILLQLGVKKPDGYQQRKLT